MIYREKQPDPISNGVAKENHTGKGRYPYDVTCEDNVKR